MGHIFPRVSSLRKEIDLLDSCTIKRQTDSWLRGAEFQVLMKDSLRLQACICWNTLHSREKFPTVSILDICTDNFIQLKCSQILIRILAKKDFFFVHLSQWTTPAFLLTFCTLKLSSAQHYLNGMQGLRLIYRMKGCISLSRPCGSRTRRLAAIIILSLWLQNALPLNPSNGTLPHARDHATFFSGK